MKSILAILAFLMISVLNVQANPLPVNDAFKFTATQNEPGRLNLSWSIAEGYYLYRDHITAKRSDGAALDVDTPEGQPKDDPTFGQMQVYHDRASAAVVVDGTNPVEITYQGCQEDGICYRPETRLVDPVTLKVTAVGAALPGTGTVWSSEPAPVAKLPVSAVATDTQTFQIAPDKGIVQSLLERGGVALMLAGFLAFGILLAFTPCVFPMYPIVAGTLAREGDRLTPWRGFTLTAIYVVSLASAFALIGAVAGWSGQNLQMLLQSPWMALAVAAVFALLALSMFGLFELQLPSRWTSAITRRTGGRTGSKTSAAILGFSSVLIVGPCVTAPLAGALIYIAQTANVALGAAALFALGIGKGVPLIVLGTLGGKAMPRAGRWMETVKYVFGFGFLATSIWMVSPLLGAGIDLVLWAILLFAIASFAFFGLWEAGKTRVAARAVGMLSLVYAVILMLGAASGGTDPLKPLAAFAGRSTNTADVAQLHFEKVGSVQTLKSKLDDAKNQRPTLVYFTADWCVACHTIDRSVFPDVGVRRDLGGYQLIKADLSDMDTANTELMAQLQVAGPPTMLFFNRNAQEVSGTRLVGNVAVDTIAKSAKLTGAL